MPKTLKILESSMSLIVGDAVAKGAITVDEKTSVRSAASLMQRYSVSSLVVVEGPRLLGIVIEKDLVTRVLAVGGDPSTP